jgi:Rieske Fe-S protein
MEHEKNRMTRRSFLDTLLGIGAVGWLGTVLYPIYEYLQTPPLGEAEVTSVVAANIKNLKPNSGGVFKFGRDPGLLVLGPDGKLRAFSGVCTHLDCTVQYRSDLERIWVAEYLQVEIAFVIYGQPGHFCAACFQVAACVKYSFVF